MDKFKAYLKSKRHTAIYLFAAVMTAGIILMCADSTGIYDVKKDKKVQNQKIEQADTDTLEKRLEQMLSSVEGAGQVRVMITYKSGKEIVAAVNNTEDITKEADGEKSGESRKVERKIVLKNNNEPVVLKELNPKVEGILIVAQGGGNTEIRQRLISGTKALLDVDEHKIEVLKMK